MFPLICVLMGSLSATAPADKPEPLRYLRPGMEGKLVPECEVSRTTTEDGSEYVSRTERPKERMTLTLRYNDKGQLLSADLLQEAGVRRTASLIVGEKGKGQLKRGGSTDYLKDLPADPVVTTAPDWSDIFQLVRRYDLAKGGKQETAGLWIHPVQVLQRLTFTIEKVSEVTVTVKEKEKDVELRLNRFRVTLRSGEYAVWADGTWRVVRLAPAGAKDNFVVLQGFQQATKGLTP